MISIMTPYAGNVQDVTTVTKNSVRIYPSLGKKSLAELLCRQVLKNGRQSNSLKNVCLTVRLLRGRQNRKHWSCLKESGNATTRLPRNWLSGGQDIRLRGRRASSICLPCFETNSRKTEYCFMPFGARLGGHARVISRRLCRTAPARICASLSSFLNSAEILFSSACPPEVFWPVL